MASTLNIGDDTPSFDLSAIDGRRVRLSDYAGGYVLVAFLRYAGCPWCNLAVHRLAVEQPLLKDTGCEIITFIQSPKESIETNIMGRHKLTPRFPIIADPEMNIYEQFGVKPSVFSGLKHAIGNLPSWLQSVYKEGYNQTSVDGNLFLAPATFLVSSNDQKIIRIDYESDLYDHESFTRLYDTIADHRIHGITT